jgi:putative lipoprotein
MCAPAPLNDHIAKDWQYVRSYTMKDDHLFLSLMADGGTYEFEPMSSEGVGTGKLKGTGTYRERMLLPTNAVFEATLEEVARADAPAEVMGKARIEHPRNPPIPFEITYDPSRIDPNHRYAVRARIEVDGKSVFATDQNYPVLTAGHGNEVNLLLRRSGPASGSAPSAQPLENTYWKLTGLGDTSVTVPSKGQEPHLIFNSETRRVSGSGGCNRLTGGYELNADQLKLSQIAGTMMACAEGMETEQAFLQALGRVNKWKIAGEQLELFDDTGNLVARLEARQMK